MKKLITAALLFAAALPFSVLAPTIAAAQSAAHTNAILVGSIIDIDAQLPSEVKLPDGAVVIFVQQFPHVGSNLTTMPSGGPTGSSTHLTQVNVDLTIAMLARPGYRVVSAYKATGMGSTSIDITQTAVMPNAKLHTETIKITVAPGCYKTMLVVPDAQGKPLKAPTVTCN